MGMLFLLLARLIDDYVATVTDSIARRRAAMLKNSLILSRMARHPDSVAGPVLVPPPRLPGMRCVSITRRPTSDFPEVRQAS